MISFAAWPRTQRNPWLSGLSGSPLTDSRRPSSISTSIPQSVGWQFIGHIVRNSVLIPEPPQTRPIAAPVSVGDVLNATRAPAAAAAFTSASSTGVCAGSRRTPPPITTTSTGLTASAARAAARADSAPPRASISSHSKSCPSALMRASSAWIPLAIMSALSGLPLKKSASKSIVWGSNPIPSTRLPAISPRSYLAQTTGGAQTTLLLLLLEGGALARGLPAISLDHVGLLSSCGTPKVTLSDDDTRGLPAQHRDQAGRDHVNVLGAYDARLRHQLENANPRAHREPHRAPDASLRRAHDADARGIEARPGQRRRDHDVDALGEAQPDLSRRSLEQKLGLGRLSGTEIDKGVQALQASGHGGGDAIERGERARRDAQRMAGGRRDGANLALEDRIGERDRAHRPHLRALQCRRHEGTESRRTARLDDEVIAAREELLGGVGHREAVEIARGASEQRRQRMRSGLAGQQRARDRAPDRPAPDEADPFRRCPGIHVRWSVADAVTAVTERSPARSAGRSHMKTSAPRSNATVTWPNASPHPSTLAPPERSSVAPSASGPRKPPA